MCLEKGLESRRLCVMDKQQGEICGRRNRVGNTVEGRAAPGKARAGRRTERWLGRRCSKDGTAPSVGPPGSV